MFRAISKLTDSQPASVLTPTGGAPRHVGRALLLAGLVAMMAAPGQSARATGEVRVNIKPIPTQFIAALGDPGATSGRGAQSWGLWRLDPGPRGVRLNNYERLQAAGGVAPAQWKFDSTDWWLEENGLIMEAPEFPVGPGRYIVTGDREMVAMLTIHPKDQDGDQRWELDKGATLYDVTHLGCRSARYTPATSESSCSPVKAPKSAFRVSPGAAMPPVEGCNKQDYTVLFVIGVVVEN
ncbi:MAG TPA: hypothetical protein VIT83_05390 [Gammaproteobacteria bacterium]